MFERLEARGIARLEHIPLGVNLDLFHPAVNGHNGNGTCGANGKATILFVGRLSKEKDIPVLFAAFDRLSAQGGFRLRVAGDGPLRREVEEFARSRSGVEFLGLCPYGGDLARLYREADVLAVPSASETFGLIILEALASGIPVVAVRSGGPVHLLRSDLGALARPGDPGDFADKIERVIRERQRAEPYRDYVASQYSWDRTFDRMASLYRELARR
jgi:glycosyltransferase involved in cell wall biosynthesis